MPVHYVEQLLVAKDDIARSDAAVAHHLVRRWQRRRVKSAYRCELT